MTIVFFLSILLVVAGGAFGRTLALARVSHAMGEGEASNLISGARAHSLPRFHGYMISWHIGLAALVLFVMKAIWPDTVTWAWLVAGLCLASAAACLHGYTVIASGFRARNHVEYYVRCTLLACSAIAVLITFGIVLSLIFESARFFAEVPLLEFLTGLQWSPQTAIRIDQAGQSGAFGAVPIFAGTFMVMAVAMVIAIPIGLMIAICLSEYASPKLRAVVKPPA